MTAGAHIEAVVLTWVLTLAALCALVAWVEAVFDWIAAHVNIEFDHAPMPWHTKVIVYPLYALGIIVLLQLLTAAVVLPFFLWGWVHDALSQSHDLVRLVEWGMGLGIAVALFVWWDKRRKSRKGEAGRSTSN